MAKKSFFEDPEIDEGPPNDGPVDRPSPEEIKAAAEIVLYLEMELGVDVRRLRVRVIDGLVHLQGSVASADQRKEIETVLETLPWVRGVDSYLTVKSDD